MEDKESKEILASLEGKDATDILKALFVDFTKYKAESIRHFSGVTGDVAAINKNFKDYREKNDKYIKELNIEREEVQATLNYHDEQISKLSEDLAAANARIQMLEGEKVKKEVEVQNLKTEIVDLKCRSMSGNIMVHKVPETEKESKQKLIKTVRDIFTDKMNIPEEKVEKMVINRIHRLGQKDSTGTRKYPRSIVLHVPLDNDRQLIFSHAKNLKDADVDYAISGQYPPEISETRAILKESMQSEDFKNKDCKLIHDRLYVDGNQHIPGFISERNAPECYNAAEVAWDKIPKIYTTRTITDNGNSFVAYAASVNSKQDAKFILDMIKGMQRESPATHLAVAYRFSYGNNTRVLEYSNDDGEFGVGRKILGKLRGHNKLGTIIVASRWYGSHIGVRRFTHYVATVEEAITRQTMGPNYHD